MQPEGPRVRRPQHPQSIDSSTVNYLLEPCYHAKMADQNAETKQVRIQKNGVGAGIVAVLSRHYGVPEATVLDAVLQWLGQSLGLGLAICEDQDSATRADALANPRAWSVDKFEAGLSMADRLSKAVVDEKAVTWDPDAAAVLPEGLVKAIDMRAKKWRAEKSDRARAAASAPRRPRGSVKKSTTEKES